MVLFTDGLIERRGESIDDGIERMRSAVQADSAEAVCRQLTRTMLKDDVQDDTAIVVVRRSEVPARSPRMPRKPENLA